MKKEINIEMGRRIRAKREALHFTREQFAEKVDISLTFLAEVELGKKGFSYNTLKKACDVLHVSADYLIRGKESSACFSEINDLLSDLDDEYIPYAQDMIRAFVNGIDLKTKNMDN